MWLGYIQWVDVLKRKRQVPRGRRPTAPAACHTSTVLSLPWVLSLFACPNNFRLARCMNQVLNINLQYKWKFCWSCFSGDTWLIQRALRSTFLSGRHVVQWELQVFQNHAQTASIHHTSKKMWQKGNAMKPTAKPNDKTPGLKAHLGHDSELTEGPSFHSPVYRLKDLTPVLSPQEALCKINFIKKNSVNQETCKVPQKFQDSASEKSQPAAQVSWVCRLQQEALPAVFLKWEVSYTWHKVTIIAMLFINWREQCTQNVCF